MIVLLTVGLIRMKVWMSEYFLEPTSSGRTVKVKLDLSRYATKTDI